MRRAPPRLAWVAAAACPQDVGGGDAIFAVGERKTLYLDARMAHAFDATGTAMRST